MILAISVTAGADRKDCGLPGGAFGSQKTPSTELDQMRNFARAVLSENAKDAALVKGAIDSLLQSYIDRLRAQVEPGQSPFADGNEQFRSKETEQVLFQLEGALYAATGIDATQVTVPSTVKASGTHILNKLAAVLFVKFPTGRTYFDFRVEIEFALGVASRSAVFAGQKSLYIPIEILTDVDGTATENFVKNILSRVESESPTEEIVQFFRGREVRATDESPRVAPDHKYSNKLDVESKMPYRNPQLVKGDLAKAYKYFGDLPPAATFRQIMDAYGLKFFEVFGRAAELETAKRYDDAAALRRELDLNYRLVVKW